MQSIQTLNDYLGLESATKELLHTCNERSVWSVSNFEMNEEKETACSMLYSSGNFVK